MRSDQMLKMFTIRLYLIYIFMMPCIQKYTLVSRSHMVGSGYGRKRASEANWWGRSGALLRQESEVGEACTQVSSYNKHKLPQWFRPWFLSHRVWKLWLDYDDSLHSKSLRSCSIYKWAIKIWFITTRLYGECVLKRVPVDFHKICRITQTPTTKW